MAHENDLWPCPFCGNLDVEIRESGEDPPWQYCVIECHQCGNHAFAEGGREKAILVWNLRFRTKGGTWHRFDEHDPQHQPPPKTKFYAVAWRPDLDSGDLFVDRCQWKHHKGFYGKDPEYYPAELQSKPYSYWGWERSYYPYVCMYWMDIQALPLDWDASIEYGYISSFDEAYDEAIQHKYE